MTRCLLIVLCALFSHQTSARIEIAQWLPWKFIENKLLPKDISLSMQDSFELAAGEFKPQMTFKAEVNGSLDELKFLNDGIAASHKLSSRIDVTKLSIDQVLVRVVNGNIFRVHIKAECSPFSIMMDELNTNSQLLYKEDGNVWVPDLQDFSLSIPSWRISQIECFGIGGIGEEIRNQIQAVLATPEQFEGMLKKLIGEKVSEYFYSSWSSILSSTGSDLRIERMAHPSSKGLLVHATFPGSKDVALELPSDDSFSETTPQLIMSKAGFERLMQDRINDMIPRNYNLQQVEGFAKLMSSRFMQFFVWPDLARFPKKNPFYFSPLPDQSQLYLIETASGKYDTVFNSNAVVTTMMGGSPIDYLQLGIGVQTSLNVEVSDGRLNLRTGDAKLSLAWSYGLLYETLFRPNKRIAVDVMLKSMHSLFGNQAVSQELPSIKLNDSELKLQNFNQNNNVITMDWL